MIEYKIQLLESIVADLSDKYQCCKNEEYKKFILEKLQLEQEELNGYRELLLKTNQ